MRAVWKWKCSVAALPTILSHDIGKTCLKSRKHDRCRRFLSGTPRRELLRKAGQLRRTPVVDLFSKACKSWASVAQTFRTVTLHCRKHEDGFGKTFSDFSESRLQCHPTFTPRLFTSLLFVVSMPEPSWNCRQQHKWPPTSRRAGLAIDSKCSHAHSSTPNCLNMELSSPSLAATFKGSVTDLAKVPCRRQPPSRCRISKSNSAQASRCFSAR